jgi:hypothetical protein
MPFALKEGLMKARKGFTPVPGKEKTGVGKGNPSVHALTERAHDGKRGSAEEMFFPL